MPRLILRCNLCPFDMDTEDSLYSEIKKAHENHHEGTELFVVGRFGERKKRCTNRITGKVVWLS